MTVSTKKSRRKSKNQALKKLKRLLVIDDDHSTLFALRKIFQKSNITVDTSDSLENARECIDNHYYQVILTDLVFSREVKDAGLEISAYAKRKLPGVKVILWSGTEALGPLKEKARYADVDYFFTKPVSTSVIGNIVERLTFSKPGAPKRALSRKPASV
ncbi:hypothetical protein CHISP_0716 [Chitinispirillum alkaliphilum]|nr:hypothetical protein CHISP_0716 [Chitinispirillum alkaliphilum]